MTSTHRQVVQGRVHTGLVEHSDGIVAIEGGRISYAGPSGSFDRDGWPAADVLGAGDVLVPGFIDVHCHGGFGADFSTSAEESVRQALTMLHQHGTTTVMASLVTAARDNMVGAAALFGALTVDGTVAGIHLEGPFLSHARCGAQDPQWLLPPDLELIGQLIEASGGNVRVTTFAPELEGADGLIEFLVGHGVVPSVGHTDADAPTTEAALTYARKLLLATDDGTAVPTVTHLFNGMPTIHHRSPGPAAACLRSAARGEAIVELIADTMHVDPYMVASVFELVGADNVALVTDSMAAAGLDDGTYQLGPAEVEVTGAAATLSDSGVIAGGTAFMQDVVRESVLAGVPFGDAIRSATVVPARISGLSARVGRLAPGLDADAVVLDGNLAVKRVLRQGAWIA